jgi:hypothetical protein
VNVEKLYPGAPFCAPLKPQIFVSTVGFLPPGEALSATGPTSHLGIYAKSATPPLKSGAVGGADSHADQQKRAIQTLRAQRFELLSIARTVLSRAGRAAGLDYGHNLHATAKCKHITRGEGVGVHLANEHKKAFFSGLVTCGSVWSCPVCAAKVQERRREEIAQAIDWAYKNKLQPVMVTLTHPHKAWHELGQLLEQQADALHRLRAGAPWKRVKDWAGYRGLIRALELTYGAHGWHPHTHEIWMVRADLDADELKAKVLKRWQASCIRAGLLDPNDQAQVEAFQAHAVDIKGNCSASDYLAKQDDSRHWGVDREMAKASTKAGRSKGQHPFGLLAQAATCTRSAELFVSYSLNMRGKRQLFWSAGLKGRVGIEDLSDETLAEQEREDADMLGQLDAEDWRTVREAGARAAVLDAAEDGGWPAVQALMEALVEAEIQRLEALLNPAPVS